MTSNANVNIPRSNKDNHYRYKMPVIQTKIEGKGNGIRTVVPNFGKVMSALDRPMEYGAKFIGSELGTKTKCDSKQNSCVFAGKHTGEALSLCLDKFIDMFVLCTRCKNPETFFEIKKDNIVSKCKACGKAFKIDPTHKLSNFIIKGDGNKKPTTEKKMSPKKSKAEKIDENDNEVWSLDTSSQAVSSRKQQLCNENDKHEIHSIAYPMENFVKYIQSEPSENEFVDELSQLKDSQMWSDTILIKYTFATLFSDGNIKHNFYQKAMYIEYIIKTQNDMMVVLMCVEKFMEENTDNIIDMVHILNGFYEADVIDEDAVFKWYDSKSKILSEDLSKIIKEAAKPFIDWLEIAEEEGSGVSENTNEDNDWLETEGNDRGENIKKHSDDDEDINIYSL